jgi:hypothetical protein
MFISEEASSRLTAKIETDGRNKNVSAGTRRAWARSGRITQQSGMGG